MTVSRNSSATAASGAVKVACAGRPAGTESVTAVPDVWLQAQAATVPSGSELREPSSVTVAPGFTVRSAPARATGGSDRMSAPFTLRSDSTPSAASGVRVASVLPARIAPPLSASGFAPTAMPSVSESPAATA